MIIIHHYWYGITPSKDYYNDNIDIGMFISKFIFITSFNVSYNYPVANRSMSLQCKKIYIKVLTFRATYFIQLNNIVML